jgi:hypothetical protein
VIRHAFEDLYRVEGHVDPDNARSIRMLKRTWFVREGVLRENHLFDGRFYDTAIYGRTNEGRPADRPALRWYEQPPPRRLWVDDDAPISVSVEGAIRAEPGRERNDAERAS